MSKSLNQRYATRSLSPTSSVPPISPASSIRSSTSLVTPSTRYFPEDYQRTFQTKDGSQTKHVGVKVEETEYLADGEFSSPELSSEVYRPIRHLQQPYTVTKKPFADGKIPISKVRSITHRRAYSLSHISIGYIVFPRPPQAHRASWPDISSSTRSYATVGTLERERPAQARVLLLTPTMAAHLRRGGMARLKGREGGETWRVRLPE